MIEDRIQILRRAAKVSSRENNEHVWCVITGNEKLVDDIAYNAITAKDRVQILFRESIKILDKYTSKRFDCLMLKGETLKISELRNRCNEKGGASIEITNVHIKDVPNLLVIVGPEESMKAFNGETNLVTTPADASNINQVFKFEDAGNNYFYLKNLNANGYLNPIGVGDYRSTVVASTEEACKVNVVSLASGCYNMAQHRLQNQGTALYSLYAENNPNPDKGAAAYACSGWNENANSPSAWYIIPATELEVEVAAKYGSIYLPFDVKLAEGDKAYAVTATSETYATLAEKEDIPAGEGAILAQGTYTLNIAEATSDWTENKLEGTTVNSYVEANAYVLANGEDGIGLYKAKLNKDETGAAGTTRFLNNANKAYLPASAVSAVFAS